MNTDLAQDGSNNYSATYWGNLEENSRSEINRYGSLLHSVSEHQVRESGEDCSRLLSAEPINSHYINEYCKFFDNKNKSDDAFERTTSDSVKHFSFHFKEHSLNKPVVATTGERFDLQDSQQTAYDSACQFDMNKVLNQSKQMGSFMRNSPGCEANNMLNQNHGGCYLPTNPYFHTRNMASHNFTFFGLLHERADDGSLNSSGGISGDTTKRMPSEIKKEVQDVGKGRSATNASPTISDRYQEKGTSEFGYGLASFNLTTSHKSTEGKGSQVIIERLWEGSLQLNTTTKVSAVAYFKSGEKADGINWSQHIEVKGKVRLQAFEKFIQELPRSRSRAMMVISLCCNISSKDGSKIMKDVSKYYKDGERVGFAQIAPRIDLYVCPRCDTIITILAKHGFFKGVSAVDDDQDSLIGCVVWRRDHVLFNSENLKKKKENPLSEHLNSPEFSNVEIHSPLTKNHDPTVKQSSSGLSLPVHLYSLVQVDTKSIPSESQIIPAGKQSTIENAVQNIPPFPCNSPTPNIMQNPLEASQMSNSYVVDAKNLAVHSGAPSFSQVPPVIGQMTKDSHNSSSLYSNSAYDPTYFNTPEFSNVEICSPHTKNHGPTMKHSAADIWQPACLHRLLQRDAKNMLSESRITLSGEGSSIGNAVPNNTPISYNSPTITVPPFFPQKSTLDILQNSMELSQTSSGYMAESKDSAVRGASPVPSQAPPSNSQVTKDSSNLSTSYANRLYDSTYFISSLPFQVPASQMSVGDGSNNPASEAQKIDTGPRTATIGIPGPPPLQSEVWKQSDASNSDQELSKGVPNIGTLMQATELENAPMLFEQVTHSHSGPSRMMSKTARRSVNLEEDDLPEFDFGSACGIAHWSRSDSHRSRHENSLIVNHSASCRSPLEVNKKAGDTTHSPSASFFPDIVADAQRITGSSYDNKAADKSFLFALKHDMNRVSMIPSAAVSICETKRSRWSDEDDDMPEWCPPDLGKFDKLTDSPTRQFVVVLDTFPGTSASRSSVPAQAPVFSPRKREPDWRYHDGLLGPYPSSAGAAEPRPKRPAVGHAQVRPRRSPISSRYSSRTENMNLHNDSPRRGWKLPKHHRHS